MLLGSNPLTLETQNPKLILEIYYMAALGLAILIDINPILSYPITRTTEPKCLSMAGPKPEHLCMAGP